MLQEVHIIACPEEAGTAVLLPSNTSSTNKASVQQIQVGLHACQW